MSPVYRFEAGAYHGTFPCWSSIDEFGIVYRGNLTGWRAHREQSLVAVKTLKGTPEQQDRLDPNRNYVRPPLQSAGVLPYCVITTERKYQPSARMRSVLGQGRV